MNTTFEFPDTHEMLAKFVSGAFAIGWKLEKTDSRYAAIMDKLHEASDLLEELENRRDAA